jgi:hypothetical protein
MCDSLPNINPKNPGSPQSRLMPSVSFTKKISK